MARNPKGKNPRQNKQRSGEPISELWGLFTQWAKNQASYNWHMILYVDEGGRFSRGYIRQGGDLDDPLVRFDSIEDGIVELMGLLIG